MVKLVFLLFLLSFHFLSFSQSEKDSVYNFDWFFNYSAKESNWKIRKLDENKCFVIFKTNCSDTGDYEKETTFDNYQKIANP